MLNKESVGTPTEVLVVTLLSWMENHRCALILEVKWLILIAMAVTGTVLLSSCTSSRPVLPDETVFKHEVRGKDPIFVTLRSEDGKDLLFAVDTGCPTTTLDSSLEPTLGKCIGRKKANWAFWGKQPVRIFRAPKLYLGSTQLLTGERVEVGDFVARVFRGQPVAGILGLDCLQHYCIQFDFSAKKMRFLDPERVDRAGLGKPFPLGSLFGDVSKVELLDLGKVWFRVDTGLSGDGDVILRPQVFREALWKPTPFSTNKWEKSGFSCSTLFSRVTCGDETYTNVIETIRGTNSSGDLVSAARFSRIQFGGETYSDVVFVENSSPVWPAQNWIGLRFLARHVVTLDFPRRTMYLKRDDRGGLKGRKG